jgi:uncharacterized RDD family membrane protein YckC
MDIRSIHHVRTAENTWIEVELAGICSRMLAFLIDIAVFLIVLSVVFFLVSLLDGISPELAKTLFNLFFDHRLSGDAFLSVVFALLFGMSTLAFCYHFFQEWLWRGRTIGKHCMRLRVVRDNGQPIGFWEAFGRNVMRFFLDVYPMGLGIYPMILSSREKRFGDYLVGTLVINDQRINRPTLNFSEAVAKMQAASSPASESLKGQLSGQSLSPEEFEVLRTFLARRSSLRLKARRALEKSLVEHFAQRLYLSEEQQKDSQLLERLYEEYRAALATTPR